MGLLRIPPLATTEGIAFPFLRYCYILSSLSALNYVSVLAQCFFLHPLHMCWELFFTPLPPQKKPWGLVDDL